MPLAELPSGALKVVTSCHGESEWTSSIKVEMEFESGATNYFFVKVISNSFLSSVV